MGGIIRKPKIRQAEPQEMVQELAEQKAEAGPGAGAAAAPREEKQAAARRRARRGGMRSLLGGGRQAGGDAGTQTTLGAG